MNKIVLSLLTILSTITGSSVFGIEDKSNTMTYDQKIDYLQTTIADSLKTLGDTPLNESPFFSVGLIFVNDAGDIVKSLSLPSIVPAATKAKLLGAIDRIRKTITILEETKTPADRIAIAQNAIKPLEAVIPGLKVGLLDIYKTPTDLKKAVKAIVDSFLDTLKRWTQENKKAQGQ